MKYIYKYWYVYLLFILISQFFIWLYNMSSFILRTIECVMMIPTEDNTNISILVSTLRISIKASEIALGLVILSSVFMVILRLSLQKGYYKELDDEHELKESIMNTLGIISNHTSSFNEYKTRSGFLLSFSAVVLVAMYRIYNTSVDFSELFNYYTDDKKLLFTIILIRFATLCVISILYGEIISRESDKIYKVFGDIEGGIYKQKYEKKMNRQ